MRFDYKVNGKNSIYFRFFRDNGTDNTPESVTGRRVAVEATPQNGVFSWQSIFGSNRINEFRLGYNGARTRINGQSPTINGFDLSAVTINISGSVAQSGITGQGSSSGISVSGGLVRANSATNGRGQPYTPYSLSFINSYDWTPANHNIKFGGEVRLIRLFTDRLGGTTYTFSNLNAFLGNSPSRIQYLDDVSAPSPFNNGATGQRKAEQEYYIAYGQDEWKIRPNLTLSYGLRYECYTPLREANNLQVLFDVENGGLKDPNQPAFKSKKTNFGPRIALTYSPDTNERGFFSGGKTLFRGGFGIYYGPGQTEDQIQPIESDRISSTISSGSLFAFPANIPAIVDNFNNNPLNRQYQPRAYAADYTIPEKVYQYTVSWQQELPYKLVSTVAYVGSQGRNLFLRRVTNKILPGQTTIANGANLPTGVGIVNRVDNNGRVVGVNTIRQFDILNGASRNVRRPNLIPGINPYLDNDRNFLNPAAFSTPEPGTFGNLPRNAFEGQSFCQFDLVLAKRFRIKEQMNIEFRTEIFNIFNITNFSNPSSRLNNALPTLQPGQPFTQSTAGSTFGLLRSTVERSVGLGTNRQIQFALRFNF